MFGTWLDIYVSYVSHGAGSHFKNNKNMLNLSVYQNDFDLPASWNFSVTSHGEGLADGIGAAIKSHATRHLLKLQTKRAFLPSKEFYDFIDQATDHQKMKRNLEPNRAIDVFYAPSEEVEQLHRDVLLCRWSTFSK